MIFRGRYKDEAGIFRPYMRADVLSPANEWVMADFLADTGADETFLDFSFIKKFGIDTKGIDVRDDVGGSGVPYFQINSALKLISPGGTKVFKGKINIFLDPHSSEVPLLGRDVLDNFIAIFDRGQNSILLLDEGEHYEISVKR
ncbi:hypothetical protein KJ693_05125 [bacterium]|nr:hypothetical protein [bacterium]MBU1614680.1 hypothetical protein [bacterium]